ncbi:MAG: type IV pilus assembly protein PilM, partial [Phycisphaerae bacterium]
MASKLPVWGIDVGQCSLKAIKLQSSGDKVELQGFDLVEHDQILSQAEADSTSIMTKAIETFASRNDISNARIVVSVPGQQTLTRFTKMPPVEPKKIPDMVQYEASQQIPFDMDEVVWDYQIFTEGETAEVEVGIFAIRKELIRNYLSIFTQLGVEPSIVQTGPMASYNTMRYEVSLDEGEAAILLDMGALATDLIVVEGSRIWSRPIPIGGNKFTEALVSAFKVPFKKAERLKRNAAASKYARQIFQAMRPVFADLVSEVQRSIGFYTSTHRDANITRVIGMGNAFKLPGLQKFLHQNLSMKVDKLSEFTHLIETGIAKKAEFDENSMSLAVAYGLALQGLELSAVDSNLLPVEVRRTLLWGKKRPWFAASAACLAMASGLLWFGSVMAKGSLSEGLGGLAPNLITPTRYPSSEAAMRAINATGGSTPIKRAADVAGAAKKLKQEFNSAKKTSGDEATLNKLAKFPANNVYIPRILDVIHRSFEAATPSELKDVKTADDYVRLAQSLPRDQRKEIWIEDLQIRFGDDP